MRLIFSHVPKTAGISFRQSMIDEYGYGSVGFQVTDRPTGVLHGWHGNEVQESSVIAVGGHLQVDEWSLRYPDAPVVTWLREPLHRVVSHYWFSRRTEPDAPEISLVDWAREKAPWLKTLLGSFDIDRFRFVGVSELYSEQLPILASVLGWSGVAEHRLNVAPQQYPSATPEEEATIRGLYRDEHEWWETVASNGLGYVVGG